MRLIELNPRWACDANIVIGGQNKHFENRHGMAVSFECPCCRSTPRATRIAVWFMNPIDGLPPTDDAEKLWLRSGTTFDDLSLLPSIDASAFGHWHGSIAKGEISW